MAQIKGVCPHNCPDTCGWVVTLDDAGVPVKIGGDPDHPYTRGWLCTKVNRYLEFVLHPERLRAGGGADGPFQPRGAHPGPEALVRDDALDRSQGAGIAVREDRLRTVLGDNRPPPRDDLVQRLLPGDGLE